MATATNDLRADLMKRAVPLVEANPESLIARSSDTCPHATECALDIAAGWRPITAWGVAEDIAFLAVRSRMGAEPVIFAFASPTHDAFLCELAEWGHFEWRVEGMIPVTIPVRQDDAALIAYLGERGCQT